MSRKKLLISFLAFALITASVTLVFSWGFWAHKRVNRMAVFTLPPGMIGFYKAHIEFVTSHAADPDMRRNVVKEEAARHYIDIDHYGEHPFDSMPKRWMDATKKYTEDTLQAYGIVPWHIDVMVRRLTSAFVDKNLDRILKVSADLGHYIGDAHVPLHTTENYNGQLTNQKGIHGFWESRIPESFGENYDYFVGKAKYIDDPLEEAWKIVKASHAAVDSVLRFERELNSKFPSDQKYSYEQMGGSMMSVYSAEYTKAYDEMLSGMVERRARAAIISVGSYWYTAWVNAGQPSLVGKEGEDISEELKKELKAEEELWKTGKRIPAKGHED